MKITKQGQESPNLCNIPYYNYKEEEEEEEEGPPPPLVMCQEKSANLV